MKCGSYTLALDGGPPKQLTNFKSNQIVCFGWSLDGKKLALALGTVTSVYSERGYEAAVIP